MNVTLGVMARQRGTRDETDLTIDGGAGARAYEEGLDPEEAKIYLQSIPTEKITRDFIEALLEEHHENQRRGRS